MSENTAQLEADRRRFMLAHHLRYNFFPAIHDSFVDAAIVAIDACNSEEYDHPVNLPNGLTLSASDVVAGLHLESEVTWPEW